MDEVVAADQVLARALEVAGQLAELPRATYRTVKAQLRGAVWAQIDSVMTGSSEAMQGGWLADETTAAAAAVLRGES